MTAPQYQRVRIVNVRSLGGKMKLYLGLEGVDRNWGNEDNTLCIRQHDERPPDSSPQVWSVIPFQKGSVLLMNQHSGFVASIRARSKSNGDRAIQYHKEFTPEEPFQQWKLVEHEKTSFLIQNVNSDKYLGPEGREINDGQFVIQWDNQTSEDKYQLWVFEPV